MKDGAIVGHVGARDRAGRAAYNPAICKPLDRNGVRRRGMYGAELYGRVRLAVLRDGMSLRKAARRFGIDRGTVAKILKHSPPPGYTRAMPVRRP